MDTIRITDGNMPDELKKRNALAFEYMMDKYGRLVYSLVFHILEGCGSAEDVEECASDVFVQAWNEIDKYDSDRGSFKTWIMVMAKYRALDYRRRLLPRMVEEPVDESSASDESIEREYARREQVAEVLEAVRNFSREDRDAFIRRYFMYQSIEDISAHMGMTKGAVYKRLWRCRNLLKDIFGGRSDWNG